MLLKNKFNSTFIVSLIFLFIVLSNNSSAVDKNIRSSGFSVETVDDSVWIDSDSDFVTYGFNGSGTENNPYVIENLIIRTGIIQVDIGIYISGVSSYFIVQNCDIDAYYYGIQIYNVAANRTIIFNNTIHDIKGGIGIDVYSSPQSLIANNTIVNMETGIFVYLSHGSEIIFNTCSFNQIGIYIASSSFSRIEYNEIEFNYDIGLYIYFISNSTVANNKIYKNEDGMILYIDFSIIENNTVEKNDYYGIFLYKSNYTTFRYNLIYNNERYGLYFYYRFNYVNCNNTLYGNLFITNDLGSRYSNGVQALDYGINNTWYSPKTSTGNYWWDYNGSLPYYEFYGVYDLYPIIAPDQDNDSLDFYLEEYVYFTNPNLNDTDHDNLLDGEEVYIYETNPKQKDSDFDFLYDGDEILIYNCNPLNPDTDGDHIKDGVEVHNYGTDPTLIDSDGDLMWDGFEIIYGLNPLLNDSYDDPDGDNLLNIDEFLYNSNPFEVDSDFDGLGDYEEVHVYYSNPSFPDTDDDDLLDGEEVNIYNTDPTKVDSDGDKLFDGDEVYIYLTNPALFDTDSDGMDDGWEIQWNLDPLIDDSQNDPDEDGLTNLEEYKLGTKPKRADTDGDGFPDGKEVRTNHDPLEPLDFPLADSVKVSIYVSSSVLGIILIGGTIFILNKKGIIKKGK